MKAIKPIFLFSLLLAGAMSLSAQNRLEFEVWPNGAPNDNGLLPENEKGANIGSISGSCVAHLTVFVASKPNGQAVVACPGGGYTHLAMNHEGMDLAEWFNAQGITYAVLKYRMPQGNYQVPLCDAMEAIRIVRAHADEWGVKKVGIMGSSAGGHLASMTSTHYDDKEALALLNAKTSCTGDFSTRPDFQILFYPVISVENEITHQGTRVGVVGREPTDEAVKRFSNYTQVNAQTPPAILLLSADDRVVPAENSIRYFQALVKNGVPVNMHIYPTGGHGWGFRDAFIYKPLWTQELSDWLRRLE